jgi:CRISPR-associated protein Cas1
MIKRTIEISQKPFHVAVKNEQLVLTPRGDDQSEPSRIPCEDLGVLLVDQYATTYSHQALTTLMRHQAAVVLCGSNHLPAGMLLPLADHCEIVQRLNRQIAMPKPLGKRLWRQIVVAKIRAQAANLTAGSADRSHLLALARQVRSGDPSNVEAHAARRYWSVWLADADAAPFRRDPDGAAPNNLLNYGYAVMRAAVARALVAAGLHPALGINHKNRSNAFCLADDLMEPLRPIVDARTRELHGEGQAELVPYVKQALLELLAVDVICEGRRGPLMVALHRQAASLVKCLERKQDELLIPELQESVC